MTDRWQERPEPVPGEGVVSWHMLMREYPEVADLARQAQRRLAGFDGLHITPVRWLHVTTLLAGPAAAMMRTDITTGHPVPRWLRFVMVSDRAWSSWYVGTGFFFAPLLAVVSPPPTLTTVLWVLIALAGLWLGLLGIAMATGLAMVLRAGAEIPEDYWWSILDGKRAGSAGTAARRTRPR